MDHRGTALLPAALILLAVSGSARPQTPPSQTSEAAGLQAKAAEALPSVRDGSGVAGAVVSTGAPWRPLSGKERLDLYVRQAFASPGVFFRAAGPALGSHLRNDPPEWQQGMAGYSRRFANRFGRFALKETYEAAGAAALGHEVRYLRSTRSGFLARAGHALKATFVTYDRNGQRTPHFARLGAAFAAEFTGNVWMPAGHRTRAEALRGVGLELGMNSLFNLFREFSPEIRRSLRGK